MWHNPTSVAYVVLLVLWKVARSRWFALWRHQSVTPLSDDARVIRAKKEELVGNSRDYCRLGWGRGLEMGDRKRERAVCSAEKRGITRKKWQQICRQSLDQWLEMAKVAKLATLCACRCRFLRCTFRWPPVPSPRFDVDFTEVHSYMTRGEAILQSPGFSVSRKEGGVQELHDKVLVKRNIGCYFRASLLPPHGTVC